MSMRESQIHHREVVVIVFPRFPLQTRRSPQSGAKTIWPASIRNMHLSRLASRMTTEAEFKTEVFSREGCSLGLHTCSDGRFSYHMPQISLSPQGSSHGSVHGRSWKVTKAIVNQVTWLAVGKPIPTVRVLCWGIFFVFCKQTRRRTNERIQEVSYVNGSTHIYSKVGFQTIPIIQYAPHDHRIMSWFC